MPDVEEGIESSQAWCQAATSLSSLFPSLLLLLPFAKSNFHAYKFIWAAGAATASGQRAKGGFRKEGSLIQEASEPAPVASFPSEVTPAGEFELLRIFANSFLDLLSKHIKMPVKIFAALLNLSGRLNWGENGNM